MNSRSSPRGPGILFSPARHSPPERKEHTQRNGQERRRGHGQRQNRNCHKPGTAAERGTATNNGKPEERQNAGGAKPGQRQNRDNHKPELRQHADRAEDSGRQRRNKINKREKSADFSLIPRKPAARIGAKQTGPANTAYLFSCCQIRAEAPRIAAFLP